MENKITRRQFLENCVAVLSVVGFMGTQGCGRSLPENAENPYEYDIEGYKNIDAAKFLYDEKTPIKVDAKNLKALALDGEGNIIAICDGVVLRFRPDGKVLGSFRISREATCVAEDDEGRILVGMKEHVEVYGRQGQMLARWNSLGETASISGISANNSRVILADYGNKILWLFNSDGSLRKMIKTVGDNGRPENFTIPSPYFDAHFDTNGDIWAINPGKLRLVRFDAEGRQKSFWGKASMDLDGFPGCCNPTHFAFTSGGDIVTSEKGIARVKLYSKDGVLKGVVAGPKSFVEGTTGLSLAAGRKGDIYVADPVKGQIRVFRPKERAYGQ